MPIDPRARFAITADASDYKRKLKDAQRSTNTFANSVRSTLRAGAVAGTAAITATAFAMTRLAVEAAKSADALAKQADILGISTQKLAAYQHAARLSGSSNEGLEKGMRKLQKSIIDATNGLTTYTRAFEALRLDPAELKEMAPDEQFEALGKAFAGVKNQAERVAVAYDLFGGRNTALLNTLVLTGEQLNKIEADTKAWGVALSRVDARQIEKANDAVERSKTALQGLGTNIALAIAPFREDLANAFADSAAEANGFRSEIQATMEALVVGGNFAMNAIRGVQLALLGAKLAALEIQRQASDNSNIAVTGIPQKPFLFGDEAKAFNNAKNNAVLAEIDAVGAAIDLVLSKFQDGDVALAAFRQRQEEALATARNSVAVQPEGGPGDEKSPYQLFGEREREQLEARLEAIRQGLLTENELIRQAQDEKEAILREAEERGLISAAEHDELTIATAKRTADRLLAIERKKEEARRQLNEKTERAIQNTKMQTAQLAIGLLQALGAKNKVFAAAAIVVEKALAIQRTLLANRVAAELAFASQLIPGDPTSLARAAAARAAVLAQGKISAALIAATGAVQIATLGSGSTGAPLGTPVNPVYTDNANQGGTDAQGNPTSPGVVINFNVNGDVNGENAQNIFRQFRDMIEDQDAVLFTSRSRQAIELASV